MRHARLAVLVAAALVFGGCASEEEKPVEESAVPKPVLDARAKAYPSAKTIGWVQEGDEYEVKLDDGGKKLEVEFKADGTINEVEEEIALDAAPDSVKKTIASSKYWKMTLVHGKKETKTGKEPEYKFVFKDAGKGYKVALAPDGAIKKEKELSAEKLAKIEKESGAKK